MLAQVLGDLVDGVGGGDVEPQRGAPHPAGRLGQRLGGRFDVDRDDARTVAGEHLGDRRADAAGRARHDGDLAVQRPFPITRRCGVRLPDVEHLAVHVRRLGRQDEPHGRFQARRSGFGVRRQVHQRDRAAVAQLLAQRAGKALQRALGDALVRAGGAVGRGADHRHAGRVAQVAQQRGEELVQPLEPFGRRDAGGVEDQPAELVGPAPAQVVADQVVVGVQRRAQRLDDSALPADQQRPGQRRITGAIAAQRLGLGNTELLGEKRTRTGVDDLREQIGRDLGSHRSYLPCSCEVGVCLQHNRIEDELTAE